MTAEVDPAVLVGDRALLGRSSTADRVADILRTRISEGYLPPGSKLSEDAIGGALGISRNTLREAFRLLTHERLLVHELNRGVFVRMLTVQDVTDIYQVRRLIECAAVRGLEAPPYDLSHAEAAVAEGEKAAKEGAWRDLGTANIHFHHAVVALARSRRLDELMRGILAELRLVFHAMDNPRGFHEPYLERNREILSALKAADRTKAELLLAAYLDDAEQQLVERYSELLGP
ncbi:MULTISPECIES: GntR family transcriptional regulator [unclassified Streptomyces]|jgi:DNA-binding GntR family transcriptional regulator|uniref:GntR family transcriptional regulator n=1 Tax=unclassified Streptomyces TaxID=2593676 RepID=UPI0027809D5F|nr:GntR family transcriptional regulator [Streptomyces sp. V1I6]MDQ0845658.1 DNA-binding GntR family transcriptional regulator [Streptomyces sp. V1I6]